MLKKFVIVTGMSGAGKTSAVKTLEDMGYYCVDNLPVTLIPVFAQLILSSNDETLSRVALGVDIRSGKTFGELEGILAEMKHDEISCEVLFMDASDEVLLKRYKETRRSHPLSGRDGRIADGIKAEREYLEPLRKKADYILDTSHLLTRDTTRTLRGIFSDGGKFSNLIITILSFGFKFGIPEEADLVFDVRFLPNPYYVENLKKLSGNDAAVSDYVMGFDVSKEFIEKLSDMVRFLIPHYADEGKNRLLVAIGCTGGRHRSVTFANELYKKLSGEYDSALRLEHRDIEKDLKIKEM